MKRLLAHLDDLMSRVYFADKLYIPIRGIPGVARYKRLREHYNTIARSRNLVYLPDEVGSRVRERLAKRGYSPVRKKMGQVHTLAFIPRISWHEQLYDGLNELGCVSEFDYAQEGYRIEEFLSGSASSNSRRQEMNNLFLEKVREVHQSRRIDWMFMYATASEVMPSTLKHLREKFGFPIVGMCLDDKQSWIGPQMDGHRGLQIDIAGSLDLAWTSSLIATEWYLVHEGNPIHLPEGTNPNIFRPLDVEKDIDVSFIGGRYGFRPHRIEFLRRRSIEVRAFGNGWEHGYLSSNGIIEVMNRSKINLGMGGINYAEDLTTLKGRDFDVPCTGNFYLTTFSPELARYFNIGKEIVSYRSPEELVELLRYYLRHDEEREAIAAAGRTRCLNEHTWLHRYKTICSTLGILGREE